VSLRLKREAQTDEGESDNLSARLVTLRDPNSVASEAFRSVRTNLFYTLVDEPPKVITITSPSAREGKSTVCANLGVVLAQAEKNTLIVDCDLRKPALHGFFGEANLAGLVNVLHGELSAEEASWVPIPGLRVLGAGPVPFNPTELLSSKRFSEFVQQARVKFDYVLVDSPPVRSVADAAIVATQGDGVLFVLDAQKTRKGALRQGMRSLEAVGARILGTVMNNVKPSHAAYDPYYPY
jgi:capsular exopolysaccharide synthesis family protein